MKTEVCRNWYQSIHFMNCIAGKCPFQGLNGRHTRRAKTFSASLAHLTLSQPVGLIILSGQILMCGFSVTASVEVKKITI